VSVVEKFLIDLRTPDGLFRLRLTLSPPAEFMSSICRFVVQDSDLSAFRFATFDSLVESTGSFCASLRTFAISFSLNEPE